MKRIFGKTFSGSNLKKKKKRFLIIKKKKKMRRIASLAHASVSAGKNVF